MSLDVTTGAEGTWSIFNLWLIKKKKGGDECSKAVQIGFVLSSAVVLKYE